MNRSQKILTLALNKELANRIDLFKKTHVKKRDKCEDDEEYSPTISKHNKIKQPSSKVTILSNLLLSDLNLELNKDAESQNTLTTDLNREHVLFVNDILETVLESVFVVSANKVTAPIKNILDIILHNVFEKSSLQYTKTGTIRKRKKFELTAEERKKIKLREEVEAHAVRQLQQCSEACAKKCVQNIDRKHRANINKEFWNMDKASRNMFVLHHVHERQPKRKTVGENSRRSRTLVYSFSNNNGESVQVCKNFFLGTLGYEKNNDRIVRNILPALKSKSFIPPRSEKNQHHNKKIDRDIIIKHINSFRPTISHYRRDHAPNRRYLPSDVTIKGMYDDFRTKNPGINFSYYLYRQVVAEQNISFAKLGHEECWACEEFYVHSKKEGHNKANFNIECKECKSWEEHHRKYTISRKQYQLDSERNIDALVITADLQKVNFLIFFLKMNVYLYVFR